MKKVKINYTVLHNFNDKQAKSYANSHQHLDVIFVLHKSINLAMWNKFQEELIKYTFKLLDPYLLVQKLKRKKLLLFVYALIKTELICNEIKIVIPINKECYYTIKICDFPEPQYCEHSYIILSKDNINGNEQLIYKNNFNMDIPKVKIYSDDALLGFYAPEPIKIRMGLCFSCEYYTDSFGIKCAVNPYVKATTCYDCKDYQLDSEIDDEEFEQYYKYEK
jgi:hypothetical protein